MPDTHTATTANPACEAEAVDGEPHPTPDRLRPSLQRESTPAAGSAFARADRCDVDNGLSSAERVPREPGAIEVEVLFENVVVTALRHDASAAGVNVDVPKFR